jgi:hypothetical protein
MQPRGLGGNLERVLPLSQLLDISCQAENAVQDNIASNRDLTRTAGHLHAVYAVGPVFGRSEPAPNDYFCAAACHFRSLGRGRG